MNYIYHDACEETHQLPTAGVRGHISIAHCEEGDSYEPQCCVHATCIDLLLPIGGDREQLCK